MDEIQNNPNIPDDIKAVLSGSVLDETDGIDEPVACLKDGVEAIIQEKYDDIFNEDSDEEMIRSRRGKKSKKEDDDWFATKKERLDREKRINPKPRGRPKRKSDEGTDDKVKRRKQTPKKKDESTRKSTDSAKKQPAEKSKVTKKPPALPFNLLDLSKKFEGKIPSLKNPALSQSNDVETVKKVVVELVNPKSAPSHNSMDSRLSQTGNSFMSPPTSMQNGLILQSRTTLSSTISSKDVKPCEITPSKYSLKV